jgi:hypothetical protein
MSTRETVSLIRLIERRKAVSYAKESKEMKRLFTSGYAHLPGGLLAVVMLLTLESPMFAESKAFDKDPYVPPTETAADALGGRYNAWTGFTEYKEPPRDNEELRLRMQQRSLEIQQKQLQLQQAESWQRTVDRAFPVYRAYP